MMLGKIFKLQAVGRMWASRRRGSVLLLVIVLLLMLSILGTAYISTSHSDRIASQVNSVNVQSDANFDGLTKAVAGIFIDDLNDPVGHLRGQIISTPPASYLGAYNPASTYNPGDIVQYPTGSNTYYKATAAVAAGVAPPTAPWVADTLPTPYRSSFRGPWNKTIQYNFGDIVTSGTPETFYWVSVAPPTPPPPVGTGPPTAPWAAFTGHLPITAGGFQTWLADRIPSVANPSHPLTGTSSAPYTANNQPYWQNISHSGNLGAVSVLGLPFESPDGSPMLTNTNNIALYPGYATLNGVTYPTLSDSALVNFPLSALPTLPASPGDNTFFVNNTAFGHTVIAGDASGQGVADSLLFRIPGANYDGLTWYAGVRIIDNNSAVNVNTAWTRDSEYSYLNNSGNVTLLSNWGFFQSGVGLLELLNEGDSAATPPTHIGGDIVPEATIASEAIYPSSAALVVAPPFNSYRFNYTPTQYQPQAGQLSATYTTFAVPLDETGQVPPNVNQRDGDFVYISPSDAFYHGFITRIDNPGYNSFTTGTPAIGNNRYQAIPFSDAAALAYHFGLPNANSGPSLLESLLPVSFSDYQNNRGNISAGNPAIVLPTASLTAYVGVNSSTASAPAASNYLGRTSAANYPLPTTPYGANPLTDIGAWWYENYDFEPLPISPNTEPVPNYMPLRSLAMTRNPVSNYITPIYDSGFSDPDQPMNTLPETLFPIQLAPLGKMMLPYYDTLPPTIATPWLAGATYSAGAIVQFGGIYYVSLVNSNIGNPPATYTGSSITAYDTVHWGTWGQYKGIWANNALYRFNDVVTGSDGNTYISVIDNPTGAIASANPGLPPLASGALDGYPQNLNIWQRQSISSHPVKTNINTATFRELYRAFWCVMSGNPANSCPLGMTPVGIPPTQDSPYATEASSAPFNTLWGMFRSVLRDPTAADNTTTPASYMDPTNVMALRAAIAAVNALGLRDQTQNVISRTVWLTAHVSTSVNPVAVEARVYSAAPNPVISEVYINTNTANGPNGYIAIELYNPYPFSITMTNWQWSVISRPNAGGTYPNLVFNPNAFGVGVPFYTMPTTIIPAGGFVILENYDASGAHPDALLRPSDLTIAQPTIFNPSGTGYPSNTQQNNVGAITTVDVAVGTKFDGLITGGSTGELVLLRPRRADGSYTHNTKANATYDPLNVYNEGTVAAPNLYDLVPVDSYDFTNIAPPPSGFNVYSYLRPKGGAMAFGAEVTDQYQGDLLAALRQSGTAMVPNGAEVAPNVPSFETTTNGSLTRKGILPIQIYNSGMPGPNPTLIPGASTAAPQKFPFGGFARNGDMLNITYIGAYRIRQVDTTTADVNTGAPFQPAGGVGNEATFLEMNSLPMDTCLADDGDSSDDGNEAVGRFVPLTTTFIPGNGDWYAWGAHLFDYLTVQSTSNSVPSVDAGYNDVAADPTGAAQPEYAYANKYWPGSASPNPSIPGAAYTTAFSPSYSPPSTATPLPLANPVYSADATALSQNSQDNVGVDGLVNINTASWKVLSMLPMVTATDDPGGYAQDNEVIAQAIITYRNGNGPFTSIFDLNKIPEFQSANGKFTPGIQDPSTMGITGTADVNFTPTATGINVNDYRSNNMVLNRISNLITTRSDTFTVYIVIEGWQNAVLTPWTAATLPGTPPAAQLEVVKRFSFIADRSAINGDVNTRFLKTLIVPND